MGREADYTTDLNEVTTGYTEQPPLTYDMNCPKLRSSGRESNSFNWSSEQCKVRISEGATCVATCKAGKAIRDKMERNGEL